MTETTKGRLIQFLQGLRADLPELKVGQPAFCTDDFSFWIGSNSGNKQIAMYSDIGSGGGGGGSVTDGSVTFSKLSPELQNQINNFITVNDIPIVTDVNSGVMTKEMFVKLDGIEAQANKTTIVDNLTTVNSTSGLSARQGKLINDRLLAVENGEGGGGGSITPATTTTLGGVIVGNHLNVADDGKLNVKESSVSSLGVVRLNETLTSTSNTQAATASAVKGINDRLVAVERSNVTMVDYMVTVSNVWSGTSAPYTQTITINGILSTDYPIAFPEYSTNNNTAISERNAWSLIGNITTNNNSITVTCFNEQTVTPINLRLRVMR